jgi:hypothetical protein
VNLSTALIHTCFILFELLVPVAKIGLDIRDDVFAAEGRETLYGAPPQVARTNAVGIHTFDYLDDALPDDTGQEMNVRTGGRYPSFIFKNETGARTRIQIAPPAQESDTETPRSRPEQIVEDGAQEPVVLDWSYNMYEERTSRQAPPLLGVSTMFPDLPNFHNPAIPLHMLPANPMVSVLRRAKDNTRTSPAMVLEMRTVGDSAQQSASVLRARSNVSVTNRSGQDILIRLKATCAPGAQVEIDNREIELQLCTLEHR